MKKIIALLLCLVMVIAAFAGCAKKDEDDLGAYVRMYLADPVYNFDPAYAYTNESALKIVSLLYENLFVLNESGKPEKSLAKDYHIDKKENTMLITLRNDAFWTDGTAVSANDVVFAWQRILDSSRSFEAAVLLYDIKNARECKEGIVPSIDDVGVKALNKSEILIEFVEGTDYDNFIRNLTCYALAPLRSDVIERASVEYDWAKSTTTIVTSGPFRVRSISYEPGKEGLTLERNTYYRRNFMTDPVDKSVTPYRLIIDYTMSDADILSSYQNGQLFFIGDVPLSLRSNYSLEGWKKEAKAKIENAMSTHSYLFNENAVIRKYSSSGFKALSSSEPAYSADLVEGKDGVKLFADSKVRAALSLAIDRTQIANAVVFAEAANGIVPNGVFNSNKAKKSFRDNDGTGLALTADIEAAKRMIAEAGYNPADYMFAISVAAYDDVHMKIAEMVQAAWGKDGVGFNVAINAINVIDNKDTALSTGAVISGVKDDVFTECLTEGRFEVAAFDFSAYSSDAFSVLARFAKGYTGGASVAPNSTNFFVASHISGFDNEEYNNKIEAAYKEKDLDKRAKLLHEAEDLLMKEMPIVPIVFNQSVTLTSKNFSKVKFSFYQTPIFTKTKLKNYEQYIPAEE